MGCNSRVRRLRNHKSLPRRPGLTFHRWCTSVTLDSPGLEAAHFDFECFEGLFAWPADCSESLPVTGLMPVPGTEVPRALSRWRMERRQSQRM